MRFENQIAVVTGAGRGIGHAIALRLANEGARVACVSRSEENAKRTADELNKARADSARAYAIDVADHAAVQPVVDGVAPCVEAAGDGDRVADMKVADGCFVDWRRDFEHRKNVEC